MVRNTFRHLLCSFGQTLLSVMLYIILRIMIGWYCDANDDDIDGIDIYNTPIDR